MEPARELQARVGTDRADSDRGQWAPAERASEGRDRAASRRVEPDRAMATAARDKGEVDRADSDKVAPEAALPAGPSLLNRECQAMASARVGAEQAETARAQWAPVVWDRAERDRAEPGLAGAGKASPDRSEWLRVEPARAALDRDKLALDLAGRGRVEHDRVDLDRARQATAEWPLAVMHRVPRCLVQLVQAAGKGFTDRA